MKKKHAERKWTVMLVPHGSGSSRAVEVSQTVVKALVGIGGVVRAAVSRTRRHGAVRAVSTSRGAARSSARISCWRARCSDCASTSSDCVTLSTSSASARQALRLLAGLSPIDKDVQQAGIGGPSGQWSERDSLAAAGANGQQALAARIDMDQLTRRAKHSRALAQRSLRFRLEPALAVRGDAVDHAHQGWLTSAFARERVHPILHLARPHEGIDVSAPMGMEIDAPAAGVITQVSWVEGYGNMLTIDHGYAS